MIPIKQTNSLPGTQFGQSILGFSAGDPRINQAILEQYEFGNIPNWLRNNWVEISVRDEMTELSYFVMPDYLCVGDEWDFLRTPMIPQTAQIIADLYGCILPTRAMAYEIWEQADMKLIPEPKGAPYDSSQQLPSVLIWHNQRIEAQRNKVNFSLISGIKKDIVISKELLINTHNVGIYGWIYPNGQIIQGLNCISHSITYYDYSHGVRLINRVGKLNGQDVDLYELLANPTYAHLISDEGEYDASSIYH